LQAAMDMLGKRYDLEERTWFLIRAYQRWKMQ